MGCKRAEICPLPMAAFDLFHAAAMDRRSAFPSVQRGVDSIGRGVLRSRVVGTKGGVMGIASPIDDNLTRTTSVLEIGNIGNKLPEA